MADTTIQALSRNAAAEITEAAGAASQTIPMSGHPDDVFLYIRNTDANTALITVSAPSDTRHAWQNDLGDLSQAVAQNEIFIMGPFDGARFKDSDEDITVAITDADGTSFSGTVGNVKIASIKQAK